MELNEMTVEQLEERRMAIVAEIEAPEADLNGLEEEMRAINAELENRKAELSEMMTRLPRERVENYARTNIIDYTITNYDAKEVEKKYNEIESRLTALQLALDSVNSAGTMEIDVVLD